MVVIIRNNNFFKEMCPIFTGNMEEMKKLREKDPTFDIDCVDGVRN